MIYDSIQSLVDRAKECESPRRLSVAGAQDEHTMEAVLRATRDGFIHPLLVGDKKEIERLLQEFGESPEEYSIVEAEEDQIASVAVELVRRGAADFLMKGCLQTATLLRAVLNKEQGLRGDHLLSHLAFMQLPNYHKLLALTDSAINIAPNLEQKKEILINSLRAMNRLGYENVNTAVLSHLETPNPKVPDSMDAAALKEMSEAGEFPNCTLEGPISFDLAFEPASAAIKGFHSPICGEVDLVLVPNIDVGNILTKALKRFAPYNGVGIVLGAKVPIVLTSRSSSAQGKYNSIALGAAMA